MNAKTMDSMVSRTPSGGGRRTGAGVLDGVEVGAAAAVAGEVVAGDVVARGASTAGNEEAGGVEAAAAADGFGPMSVGAGRLWPGC